MTSKIQHGAPASVHAVSLILSALVFALVAAPLLAVAARVVA